MTTTLADVISTCRNDYLLTGSREQRNKLAVTVNADDTLLTLSYDLSQLGLGSKVSIGLEDMGVWETNPTSKTVTVQRADFGSTAAAHAVDDLVTVNSRFTNAQIARAINDELQALSASGLFRMRTVDLTYNAAVDGYDLTGVTDVLSVYQIRSQAVGPENEWPLVPTALWQYQRDLDTSVFASGHAVFIRDALQPGYPMRVTYKAPFSTLSALTDDVVTTSGLPAEALDLLSLGAGIRLTVGREVRRNLDESQGDTRRAGEVPPGANIGANRALVAWRQQRLAEERRRLAQRYPMASR